MKRPKIVSPYPHSSPVDAFERCSWTFVGTRRGDGHGHPKIHDSRLIYSFNSCDSERTPDKYSN